MQQSAHVRDQDHKQSTDDIQAVLCSAGRNDILQVVLKDTRAKIGFLILNMNQERIIGRVVDPRDETLLEFNLSDIETASIASHLPKLKDSLYKKATTLA